MYGKVKRTFYTKIVGHTFINGYQDLLKEINIGETLIFIREPKNEYDPNAVKVMNSRGQRIGYIPKEKAEELSTEIKDGFYVYAKANEKLFHNRKLAGLKIKVFVEHI